MEENNIMHSVFENIAINSTLLSLIDDSHKLKELKVKRKRTCNPEKWARKAEAIKKLKGLEYINRNGKLMPGKVFEDKSCECARKCNDKITAEERREAMQSFFDLADHIKQNIFLRGSITSTTVKRHRPSNNTKKLRSQTCTFYIRRRGEDVRVCKKYFRDTFQVSDGRIYHCCSKSLFSSVLEHRGRHVPGNKIDDSPVIKHISSFPSYTSYYTRAYDRSRKYLNPDLTIKKMYELYVSLCVEENVQPVKEKYYYHVFSTKFHLHFKQPSKNTCKTCIELQIKTQSTQEEEVRTAEIEKAVHLRKAELAVGSMAFDKEKSSHEVYVFSFDSEKAFAFPKLTSSAAFYKRNLFVHNLGCHDFKKDLSYMYMWPETEASRSSQEVSCCLIKHIKEHAKDHKHIIAYSDPCSGQNRNVRVVVSLMKLLQSTEIRAEIIELKYLETGHSFLPNDSDISIIESCARKNPNIFSPSDWYEIIQSSKRKNPFQVIEMSHQDFYSTKPLEDAISNRKKTTSGSPVNWNNIRWIRIERSKPTFIQFKNNFIEDIPFETINIRKKHSEKELILTNIEQPLLYPCARPVSAEMKKDMMDLLTFIPTNRHDYYINIYAKDDSTITKPDFEDIIYYDIC